MIVYIAASQRDARFTRTCVASLRRFYPDVRIDLLPGGPLQRGLAEELREYWGVGIANIPPGDYGWGFVKLEPLFGRAGERFLMLDSDTVLTGPVLDLWANCDALFLVDDEVQPEPDARRLYYDWDRVRELAPTTVRPQFLFNSGQWFGTAGVLSRDDFSPWVNWTLPRTLSRPELFMPGDQGVLNWVLNQKAAQGVVVRRGNIMCWPGHTLGHLDADSVANGSAPPLIVHWAGIKRPLHRNMAGADLLAYFENYYYDRLPIGRLRKPLAITRHYVADRTHHLETMVRLSWKRLSAAGNEAAG